LDCVDDGIIQVRRPTTHARPRGEIEIQALLPPDQVGSSAPKASQDGAHVARAEVLLLGQAHEHVPQGLVGAPLGCSGLLSGSCELRILSAFSVADLLEEIRFVLT
jgi:hypothetical protein